MSIIRLPTTLLQILSQTILYFQVIVKSIIDPDDDFVFLSYIQVLIRRRWIIRLPTTLLQILSQTILYFQVIVKSIIDPDDDFVFLSYFQVLIRRRWIIRLPTTLLQILGRTILYFQFIVKSIIDPDDDFFFLSYFQVLIRRRAQKKVEALRDMVLNWGKSTETVLQGQSNRKSHSYHYCICPNKQTDSK